MKKYVIIYSIVAVAALVMSVLTFMQVRVPGPRGDTGLQGFQGIQDSQGIQGSQGEEGVPGVNLIVAMGYVYEDYANHPDGSPELVSGYNVGNVAWDSSARVYVITLSGMDYNCRDYVVVVTTFGHPNVAVFGCPESQVRWRSDAPRVGVYAGGKLWIDRAQWIGYTCYPGFEEEFYWIGSFQFVVFRYPRMKE